MADSTTTKLSITFVGADGTFTQSYNRVNPEAETSLLQSFAQTVVTNGIILEKVPTSIKSMKLVTTEETSVPIS